MVGNLLPVVIIAIRGISLFTSEFPLKEFSSAMRSTRDSSKEIGSFQVLIADLIA